MKTAIFVRDLPTTRTGATQKLWRLSEPLVETQNLKTQTRGNPDE
jgi:hypothetical protein